MAQNASTRSSAATNRRLGARDLINVGIYSAVYIVTFYIAGFIGVIPIFMPLLPLVLTITTGIPFMLYLTRVDAFGMVTITGVLVGLMMFGTGHAWFALVAGALFGFLADLVLRSGGYRRWTTTLLGFFVFSLWVAGPMMPFFVARDSYADYLTESMGAGYSAAVLDLIPTWYLAVLPLLVAVGTLIGGYFGRAVLRKHFERAGIA
jgi:energy-coupling factor transport system substrate-specific component